MPIPLIAEVIAKGPSAIPYLQTLLKVIPWLALVSVLKYYFGGARNKSERLLHGKVIIITGGLSGIGEQLVRVLASRGAQIVLLTQHSPSDPFIVEHVEDLRDSTSNELIYAEQVDLRSLHSIRLFATKWIDTTPPRRLDMVILCAATMKPRFSVPEMTIDGAESCWGVNYLANFHLLGLLSPAIRAQPPGRDVRIILSTCGSYVGGQLKLLRNTKSPLPAGREYETSKMALMVFGRSLQRRLDSYVRPDKNPNNTRVILVDPGYSRTPGMRRWLSMGSLWGLFIYLSLWPLWWLVLKSPQMGSQSFLRAAMEASLGRGEGGKFIKECREAEFQRAEIVDEQISSELWSFSEKQINLLEKEYAARKAALPPERNVEQSDRIRKRLSSSPAEDGYSGETRQTTSRKPRKAA